MTNHVDYRGTELEAMSWAVNYHRWILELFVPYLGGRIVEVGAGNGSFSELLLEQPLESLTLVEPSQSLHIQLRDRLKTITTHTEVTIYPTTFRNAAEDIRLKQRPDSIIYVNVLEHIPDDENELIVVNRILDPGGRLFIFSPALTWLFGSFDDRIGHYRRYTKSELVAKCNSAGFKVLQTRYFDFFGVVPWWIKFRLLKSDKMEPNLVRLYDNYIVPMAKEIESHVFPPIGKNLLVIAEKTQA
jgi:SAM-dependent methyltransferase